MKKRIKAIIAGCCAVALVTAALLVGCGQEVWQEDSAHYVSDVDTRLPASQGGDGVQDLYEVLPLFTPESLAAGPGAILPSQVRGFAVYYRQCLPDDPRMTYAEERPDGTVAYYRVKDGYAFLKEAADAGAEVTTMEPFGFQEVGADDAWQKAWLNMSIPKVFYGVLKDNLAGTENGAEQLRKVAPCGVEYNCICELSAELYAGEGKVNGTKYDQIGLRVRFEQGVDINRAVEIAYEQGCYWSHYPDLEDYDEELAVYSDPEGAKTEFLEEFGPDNYVTLRVPAGTHPDDFVDAFLAYPEVAEARPTGEMAGSLC